MSVEQSGQAINVEASKGQLVTGGARGFDGGRQLSTDGTSRMNREVQVRICEGLGVKLPGPTRLRLAARSMIGAVFVHAFAQLLCPFTGGAAEAEDGARCL